MKSTAFAAMMAGALAALPAGFVAAVARADDTAFVPKTVFLLPDHAYIDDRCSDARAFADAAARDTDAISAIDSVSGAKAFLHCLQLPRLNPDEDQQRYLAMAAGAALYLAATKTSGATALALYKSADSIGDQLGASAPDHTYQIVKVEGGTGRSMESDEQKITNNANGGGQQSGPPRTKYIVTRNVLGDPQKLKFVEIAQRLRESAAERMDELRLEQAHPQSTGTASPTPAPSSVH